MSEIDSNLPRFRIKCDARKRLRSRHLDPVRDSSGGSLDRHRHFKPVERLILPYRDSQLIPTAQPVGARVLQPQGRRTTALHPLLEEH